VGYESTNDLRDDLFEGTEDAVDGGDGGTLGPKDRMAVVMLLALGFG
jgi:hypothetical protein